jgi:hypothetical protein
VLGWTLKEEQDNMTNYISAKSDKAYTRPTAVAEDVFMEKADVIKTYDGIDANFKRKIARIAKAYQGQEDTGSKQLFPDSEYVTGYGLFDVITPPYNLVELSFFYDNSFANHAAVNAKVSNIVCLGYDFKMTNTALEMLDDKEDDSALRRAQRKIERLKDPYIESGYSIQLNVIFVTKFGEVPLTIKGSIEGPSHFSYIDVMNKNGQLLSCPFYFCVLPIESRHPSKLWRFLC